MEHRKHFIARAHDAIQAAEELARCEGALWCDDRLVGIDPRCNLSRLAQFLSTEAECTAWLGSDGVTLVSGKYSVYVQTHSQKKPMDRIQGIMDARQVALDLGIKNPGFSVANVARKCLEWVGFRERASDEWQQLRSGNDWGFMHSDPGDWRDGRLYDVQSCYYQLWSKLPSLYITASEHGIGWREMPDKAKKRLAELNARIADKKLLRNNLVGCAIGGISGKASVCVCGKWEKRNVGQGPFRTAGVLVVRTAWELCREASIDCESVHSAVDSVISTTGAVPKAWERVGLKTRCEATGPTEVKAWGAYCVGGKRTKMYTSAMPYADPTPFPPAPDVYYNRQWL